MSTPIAIIGMAGRFPGAEDVDGHWDNVLSDVSAIGPMPAERFDARRYFDPEIGAYGKSYSKIGGLVSDLRFDGRPYRMAPSTVAAADVAHLWALDVARAALQDAGLDPFDGAPRNMGVLVGHARGSMRTADLSLATGVEGLLDGLERAPELARFGPHRIAEVKDAVIARLRAKYGRRTEDGSLGAMASGLAGIIASAFSLTGRHAVIDAACASSLAAIQLGVNALRQGHMDQALVGGASYSQQMSVVMFAQSRALSAHGSHPFDARADGFVSSDGVGLFVLERLDDALRAGRTIRAVIRGVGGACDGKGRALWSPQKRGQVKAMQAALTDAQMDPASVGWVEAHATSTRLGDRIEVEALHDVFGARSAPLPVGSVKGNIGHAREAAGAAGLAKIIRALETETLPPTGGFRDPSPEIPWDAVAVEVLTEPRPWKSRGPRRAGLNAFGIGGLDHHLLIEEAPPSRPVVSVAAELEPAPMDIAIVGMGMRLPGASDAQTLWARLRAGEDAFGPVPAERWDANIYHEPGGPAPYRSYVARGAFLEGFTPDWRRYKVPPKIVERNDPLQFMVLESALDALEEAGLPPEALSDKRVGTLVGTVFGSDFALELSEAVRAVEVAGAMAEVADPSWEAPGLDAVRRRCPTINEDSSGSFSSSTLASRVAKTLDLDGPTMTLDAACASSLAALEAACELLRAGQADVALAGGGDRSMRIQRFEAYCGIRALSAEGVPKPYDAGADGFVVGEGAAMLALARLEDAERWGLPIRAVIRGVGSGSEGHRAGMMRPSPEGVSRAMLRAMAQAQLPIEAVGLVEGHGGGTPAGDAAEIGAIAAAYAGRLAVGELHLSSVKAQLGHVQGAAGVAGVVEAVLALEHGESSPIPRFETESSALAAVPNLQVSNRARPLPEGTWAAGVTAMGLGGIDTHVVIARPVELRRHLETRETIATRVAKTGEPLPTPLDPPQPTAPRLAEATPTVIRGESEAEVLDRARAADATELWSSRSLGSGPAAARFGAESKESLEELLALVRKTGFIEPTRAVREKRGVFFDAVLRGGKLAFAFSGQGSQYDGMLLSLLETSAAARDRWEALRTGLSGIRGAPTGLYEDWRAGRPLPADDVFSVQALVLAADLVMLAEVEASGFVPDAVTGHSYGDYAALVAASAWTVEEALTATWMRAEAIRRAGVRGGMVSVDGSARDVEAKIAGRADLYVANHNAPEQVVVAGTPSALEAFERDGPTLGLRIQRLPVPGPFHSPLMAPAVEYLRDGFARLTIAAPRIPYLSSVTATFLEDPELIRDALVRQLVEPVRFPTQIARLKEHGVSSLLEVGPRTVLTGLAQRCAPELRAVSSDHPKSTPSQSRLRTLAGLADFARPAAPPLETPPMSRAEPLSLFDPETLDRLAAEPGFVEFFARVRPSLETLVQSLWAAEAPEGEVEALPTQTPELVSELPAAAGTSREELQAFLLDALCAESGYPPDIIEVDADLEADLGIDTVKQAQVLGRLRDQYRLKADANLSLRDFPTLGHMLEYADRQLKSMGSAPAKVSRVPVVDLSARRTGLPVRAATATSGGDHRRAPSRPVSGVVTESDLDPAPARRRAPHARPSPVAEPTSLGRAPRIEMKVPPAPAVSGLSRRDLEGAAPPPERPIALDAPWIVPEIVLEGTPWAMGQAHGRALRDPIRDVLQRYMRFVGQAGLVEVDMDGALEQARKVLPAEALEEIAGIADAVGAPERWLLAYNLDTALFPAHGGCTQAFNSEAGPLHFVNEDSPLLLHLGGTLPRIAQRRRHADVEVLTFSLAGHVAGINGISSRGLVATGTTLLDAPGAGRLSGLPHPFLVTKTLEEATSFDDALARLRSSARAGRWSVLLSEATSDRAHYLEYDDQTLLEDHPVDETWVSANHARSRSGPEHSELRQRRAEALQSTVRTPEDARAVLEDRWDAGRDREVSHATMNTVRRVDTVLSLVVAPREREIRVNARVLPAGRSAEPMGELRLAWPTPPRVMRRHVLRLLPKDLSKEKPGQRCRPRTAVVLGDGPRGQTAAEVLRARGAQVVLQPWGSAPGAAEALLLAPEGEAEVLRSGFGAVRSWASGTQARLLVALTRLGGAFGLENPPEARALDAGLSGLVKAVRREKDDIRGLALDVARTDDLGAALGAELDAGCPRLEVGYLRGRRLTLTLPTRAAHPVSEGAKPWPARWLVTGGSRGVTARMAIMLAERTGAELILVGRAPPLENAKDLAGLDEAGLAAAQVRLLEEMKARPGFSPKAWRAAADRLAADRERAQVLAALEGLGARYRYCSVDLSDPAAVRELVGSLGEVQGLLHGAGFEEAKRLEDKTDALFERTVGPKVDGLWALLEALDLSKLTHLVGFGSVSGRFGGHGQADYSLANDALAGIIRTQRALHPELRACAVDWAAFSEVGLAARSSAKAFLEKSGQAFMTPDEGAEHLFDELVADLPEPEVVICRELAALDLDETLAVVPASAPGPLELVPLESPSAGGFELPLDPTSTLLHEHRIGSQPVLPAAGITAALLDATGDSSLAALDILSPLAVVEPRTALVQRDGERLELRATASRPNGVTLEPFRLYASAKRSGVVAAPPMEFGPPLPDDALSYPYFERWVDDPKSRKVWHGPSYRTLLGARAEGDGGMLWLEPGAPLGGSGKLDIGLFDGVLQGVGILARVVRKVIALPAGFERLDVHGPATGPIVAFVRFTGQDARSVTADIHTCDRVGRPWLSVRGYRAHALPS